MKLFEVCPLISILILGLIITGRIIFMKKKKVPVNSKTKKSAFVKFFIYPTFLLIFFLLIFELAKPALQISLVILPDIISNILVDSIFLKILGTFLLTCSLVFMRLTLHNFNKSFRLGMDSNNLGKLISSGMFSISRNPFFVSIELYFIGIALLIFNIFFIGFALLVSVTIHFFILKEEKFMRQNYGEEYEKYTKKVRRYF